MLKIFIHGLISGHLFSKGATVVEKEISEYFSKVEFFDILNVFDKEFRKHHEIEISQNNIDIESLLLHRTRIVNLAKEYLGQVVTPTERSRKDEFIDVVCTEIDNHSDIAKDYIRNIYDLVFMRETKEVPQEYKIFVFNLADSQNKKNEEYEKRLKELEGNKNPSGSKSTLFDFSTYYKNVEKRFIAEKKDVYKNLVGNASDENSYIDAYIKVGCEEVNVLSFLNNWFCNEDYGTVLIYGEPGHGKSLLCDKATIEFCKGTFLHGKANNVLTVSLNTGQNRTIINVSDREVEIENALRWRAGKKHKYSFEDCSGSLLFMDGFDEFIDEAIRADTNIKNIYDFMVYVNDIAANNGIHIVILSRKMAVINSLKDLDNDFQYYELAPISEMQQMEWLYQHPEYDDYIEDFLILRNEKTMRDLLGIPLLFRLIVHSRFKTISSNSVELYENLFINLLKSRKITEKEEIQSIEKELINLAYRIYCTDTNTTILNSTKDLYKKWVYAFYVCAYNGKRIGFFHRTFYQFFLSKYLYSGILNLTDENVEYYLGSLAEREIDDTVRQYLSEMFIKENGQAVHNNIEKMIEALCKTEAYIGLSPRFKSGNFEKSKILRSQNIYRNVLHITTAAKHVIQVPFKGKIDILVRKFRSDGIGIVSKEGKAADLKESCLTGAYLRNSKLVGADLSKADLRGADLRSMHLTNSTLNEAKLREANLRGVILEGAHLIEADLQGAYIKSSYLKNACFENANLRGTDFSRADLTGACLQRAGMRGAILREACLTKADLRGACMKGVDLRGANLLNAKMAGAYLRRADLRGANLTGADISKAELYDTKIDIKYKDVIDSSTVGYESIIWTWCDRIEDVVNPTDMSPLNQ